MYERLVISLANAHENISHSVLHIQGELRA